MSLTQSNRNVVNVSDISIALQADTTAAGITVSSAATYAPKASPALTGVPTSTTAAVGTNTTQIATTAFVLNQINSGIATTGNIVITNGSPLFSMIDNNGYSAFLYNDASTFYILRNAAAGATTWDSGPNGRHPMTMNLSTGDVVFSGNIGAYSDIRMKKNVETITNALDKVLAMRGVQYDMINGEAGFGFIAQELEQIFPRAVRTDVEGYKSVNYGNMVGVLVEAIKDMRNEYQAELDGLKNRIQYLERLIRGF